MKTAILFALGVLTGLAFSRVPHYLDVYANHSLPKPEYTGEKATMRYWNGGVESFPPPPAIDHKVHITLDDRPDWLNDPVDRNAFTQPWAGAQ